MNARFALVVLVCAAGVPILHAEEPSDGPAPQLKAEIKQGSPAELKLDWVWNMYAAGPWLFVVSHRDGNVNVFDRDPATGELRFRSAIDLNADLGFATRHLDGYPVLAAGGILYVSGAWTHARGDGDSIGLSWYRIGPNGDAGGRLGHIACDAGRLHASPNPNRLYLAGANCGAGFKNAITQIDLDPATGTPTPRERIAGKGIRWGCGISPDNRHLYSVATDAVAWCGIDKDGKLAYGGACPIDPPAGEVKSHALAVSPDGRNVYAALSWIADRKYYGALWSFARDEASGALKLLGKMEDARLAGLAQLTFTSDGKVGYFVGQIEWPGAGLGWFTRDAGGALGYGGRAKAGWGAWSFAYVPQTGCIYLGGNWGTKSFKVFAVPKTGR